MKRRGPRISEYFGLGLAQGQLDFVDTFIDRDVVLFVDPTAIRHTVGAMRDECVSLLQSFFDEVVSAIRSGNDRRARLLLRHLSEPSETHLGYARKGSHGLGVGAGRADQLWEALRQSEAVKTGLLQDLEDTALVIEGIDVDIISDITTNVIRAPLIRYTQAMASTYGIPLAKGVNSGPVWDSSAKSWTSGYTRLPVAERSKLLFVPKLFVRRSITYSANDYYNNYILNYLIDEHLAAGDALVQLLKNGKRRVYKTDLRALYGESKSTILDQTLKHPELMEQYRQDKRKEPRPPVDQYDLVDRAGYDTVDWDAQLAALGAITPGNEAASEYHIHMLGLLTALFSPDLMYPEKEVKIHNGRKRIDIVFTNGATKRFFAWLGDHYEAPHVFAECKNYESDPKNPELDQLAGRFSKRRGRFGFLVCRKINDRDLFDQRCRDTADDDRGFVIGLDDADVRAVVDAKRSGGDEALSGELRKRFNVLVM
jgi:hypothetical protein